jgi:hypothetical protein
MSLFADKLVQDDREPVATFLDWQGASWGLYAPKWMLWQQLILVRFHTCVCVCVHEFCLFW